VHLVFLSRGQTSDPWNKDTYCMTRIRLDWQPGTMRTAVSNERSVKTKSPSLLFIGSQLYPTAVRYDTVKEDGKHTQRKQSVASVFCFNYLESENV
jgi:hypothetical protein